MRQMSKWSIVVLIAIGMVLFQAQREGSSILEDILAAANRYVHVPVIMKYFNPGRTPILTDTPTATPTNTLVPSSGATIFVGGDGRPVNDAANVSVVKLLDSSSPLLHTGDFVDGSTTEQFALFDTVWRGHKAQIYPVPGNHEYRTAGAAPYFAYFGARAGTPGKGWHSFEYDRWHIIALNTELSHSAGSEQERWLKADLAAHPALCTIAFWHKPRWSSGSKHGNDTSVGPLWNDLYAAGAELVFNGHDHNYERFAPQNPSGALDAAKGIREFVVGTAGVVERPMGAIQPNSEISNADTWGLLKLSLWATGYSWEFMPVAGKTFTDSGSGVCH